MFAMTQYSGMFYYRFVRNFCYCYFFTPGIIIIIIMQFLTRHVSVGYDEIAGW